jgi:predicted dehydrogenase
MKKLRVGLIGLGQISEIHLEAYRDLKQIEIVAAAELREKRLSAMTEKWGFKGYSDYNVMLEKEDLDIICILVPARAHREIVEAVAKQKVNILCEKPLALTVEDAIAMDKTCRREKVKLCYGSSYRWLDPCKKAKKLIEEGILGKINLLFEMYVGGKGFENFQDLGDHHYPIGSPGGGGMGLMDHGIHLIDIFMWLIDNDVEYVMGRGNFSGKPPHTEFLTLIFKNEAIGQLLYNEATFSSDLPYEGMFSWGGSWDIGGDFRLEGSWVNHPGNIRIHGEKGALRVYYYANKLFFFSEGIRKPIKVEDNPIPSNFTRQMESFVNHILEDTHPEVTALDGIKALKVLEAAYKSFETKKFVKINF